MRFTRPFFAAKTDRRLTVYMYSRTLIECETLFPRAVSRSKLKCQVPPLPPPTIRSATNRRFSAAQPRSFRWSFSLEQTYVAHDPGVSDIDQKPRTRHNVPPPPIEILRSRDTRFSSRDVCFHGQYYVFGVFTTPRKYIAAPWRACVSPP